MTDRTSASLAFTLRPAAPADVPAVLQLIRGLAEYEKLMEECVISEAQLREQLFGARPAAEAWVAQVAPDRLVGFALFFTTFSTFLGKQGLYLEDLFVVPEARAHGVGRALMLRLARIAVERDYGRFEWSVLDWNEPAIGFYKQLGASMLPDWRRCRLTGQELIHVATLDR
ncbi:MAG TPA: GNAT family N-acetyltransferase [Polyangiales bacterium]|nr:GNAT family N-acetyltransferase [Polyangiales bacterium]